MKMSTFFVVKESCNNKKTAILKPKLFHILSAESQIYILYFLLNTTQWELQLNILLWKYFIL